MFLSLIEFVSVSIMQRDWHREHYDCLSSNGPGGGLAINPVRSIGAQLGGIIALWFENKDSVKPSTVVEMEKLPRRTIAEECEAFPAPQAA